MRRIPLNIVPGGGHEFQEQSPFARLPKSIYGGPPPTTQSQTGPGGMSVAATVEGVSDIAGSGVRRLSRSAARQFDDPFQSQVIKELQDKVNVTMTAGVVGTAPLLIRKAEERSYLLLQNTSVANSLFFALGYAPQVVAGGATGFVLLANGGNYEPSKISQEDIWVVATVAGTTWVLAVATG